MALLTINLDDGQTTAGLSLMPFGMLFANSAVLRPNAFLVSAQTSPDMSVKVSGSTFNDALVIVAADGSTYFVKNTADENVTVLANSSGVAKTDAIVCFVDLSAGDENTAGSPGAAQLVAVRRGGTDTGAPTNGEIDAATGNNPWLKLSNVIVANGATEITGANVTDTRLSAWLHSMLFGQNHIPLTALSSSLGGEIIGSHALTSSGSSMSVTGLPERRFLKILAHIVTTGGTANSIFRFNNDSGSNYSRRSSDNGAADSTTTSTSAVAFDNGNSTNARFAVVDVINIANQQKLLTGYSVFTGGGTAASAPDRREIVGKWVNTSDAITRVDVIQSSGTGSLACGSRLVVIGHD
jgi:hypothetical protein